MIAATPRGGSRDQREAASEPPPIAGGMVPPDPPPEIWLSAPTPRAGAPRGASLSLASFAQRERLVAEEEAGARSLDGLDAEVVAELLAFGDRERLPVHLHLDHLLAALLEDVDDPDCVPADGRGALGG